MTSRFMRGREPLLLRQVKTSKSGGWRDSGNAKVMVTPPSNNDNVKLHKAKAQKPLKVRESVGNICMRALNGTNGSDSGRLLILAESRVWSVGDLVDLLKAFSRCRSSSRAQSVENELLHSEFLDSLTSRLETVFARHEHVQARDLCILATSVKDFKISEHHAERVQTAIRVCLEGYNLEKISEPDDIASFLNLLIWNRLDSKASELLFRLTSEHVVGMRPLSLAILLRALSSPSPLMKAYSSGSCEVSAKIRTIAADIDVQVCKHIAIFGLENCAACINHIQRCISADATLLPVFWNSLDSLWIRLIELATLRVTKLNGAKGDGQAEVRVEQQSEGATKPVTEQIFINGRSPRGGWDRHLVLGLTAVAKLPRKCWGLGDLSDTAKAESNLLVRKLLPFVFVDECSFSSVVELAHGMALSYVRCRETLAKISSRVVEHSGSLQKDLSDDQKAALSAYLAHLFWNESGVVDILLESVDPKMLSGIVSVAQVLTALSRLDEKLTTRPSRSGFVELQRGLQARLCQLGCEAWLKQPQSAAAGLLAAAQVGEMDDALFLELCRFVPIAIESKCLTPLDCVDLVRTFTLILPQMEKLRREEKGSSDDFADSNNLVVGKNAVNVLVRNSLNSIDAGDKPGAKDSEWSPSSFISLATAALKSEALEEVEDLLSASVRFIENRRNLLEPHLVCTLLEAISSSRLCRIQQYEGPLVDVLFAEVNDRPDVFTGKELLSVSMSLLKLPRTTSKVERRLRFLGYQIQPCLPLMTPHDLVTLCHYFGGSGMAFTRMLQVALERVDQKTRGKEMEHPYQGLDFHDSGRLLFAFARQVALEENFALISGLFTRLNFLKSKTLTVGVNPDDVMRVFLASACVGFGKHKLLVSKKEEHENSFSYTNFSWDYDAILELSMSCLDCLLTYHPRWLADKAPVQLLTLALAQLHVSLNQSNHSLGSSRWSNSASASRFHNLEASLKVDEIRHFSHDGVLRSSQTISLIRDEDLFQNRLKLMGVVEQDIVAALRCVLKSGMDVLLDVHVGPFRARVCSRDVEESPGTASLKNILWDTCYESDMVGTKIGPWKRLRQDVFKALGWRVVPVNVKTFSALNSTQKVQCLSSLLENFPV